MKRYFITGLLVLVPLVITIWVLKSLIGMMDQSLLLLPVNWRPESQIGFSIPGIGTLLTLLIVLVTGVIATNFFGKRIILFWEGMLLAYSGGEIDLLQRQAGQRHAVFRFTARHSARHCWYSIRAKAVGPSRSRPATRAAT